jgi:hypothetical protein
MHFVYSSFTGMTVIKASNIFLNGIKVSLLLRKMRCFFCAERNEGSNITHMKFGLQKPNGDNSCLRHLDFLNSFRLNVFESKYIYLLRIACNSIRTFLQLNTTFCPPPKKKPPEPTSNCNFFLKTSPNFMNVLE